MFMTYAYIRVSTEHQNTDNQYLEIETFAKNNDIKIDEWIIEKVSGTKRPEKRKLGELMEVAKNGDLIICTEISRLGRSLMMIMNVLNYFLDNNIRVWTLKDGFKLGDDIQSKVLAFAFGISAEIERQLISERTKNGLIRAKSQGKHIGRKKNQKSSRYKLTDHHQYIYEEIKNGRSINSLSKELGVAWATLKAYKVRSINQIKE